MIYRLTKMSDPGWEKDFETQEELRLELIKHICGGCRDGDDTDWGQANGDTTIDALMGTPCGCEYWTEEIPDANDY